VKVQNGFEIDELHNVATGQSKSTPVDADAVLLYDSADANGLWKKLSWSNLKATLKTYFDSLYASSNQSMIDKGKGMISYFFDFTGPIASYDGLQSITSGGIISNIAGTQLPNRTNQQGVIYYSTQTATTNYAYHYNNAQLFIYFSSGKWNFETLININLLSTSIERFRTIHGFGSTNLNTQELDGVFFTYDEGGTLNGTTASPNWQCVSVANSVRTLTTTSVAVTQISWIKLRIEINATGTEAKFYVNGTLVATHTSNIPLPSNGRYVNVKNGIAKSAGVTARIMFCDYIGYEHILTTPR
jgi:hypothetical protein